MSGRTGENVQAIRDNWPFPNLKEEKEKAIHLALRDSMFSVFEIERDDKKFPELKPDQYDTYGAISEQKCLVNQFERA